MIMGGERKELKFKFTGAALSLFIWHLYFSIKEEEWVPPPPAKKLCFPSSFHGPLFLSNKSIRCARWLSRAAS